MAMRRTIRTEELEDEYGKVYNSLTTRQRDKLFYTVRRIKRKVPNLDKPYVTPDPHELSKSDIRVIARYMRAGGELMDIYKIFFIERFIHWQTFIAKAYANDDLDFLVTRLRKHDDMKAKKAAKNG